MTLESWLPGRPRWLLLPSTVVSSLVVALAAVYSSLTLRLPEHSTAVFLLLIVFIAAPLVFGSEQVGLRWLPSLRALASGKAVPSPENLRPAISELRRFPTRFALLSIATWLLAVVLLAIGSLVFLHTSREVAVRELAMGAIFGAMSAMLVGVLVADRALDASEKLAEGLPLSEALLALGAPTFTARSRLATLTLVTVGLPVVLFADAGRSLETRLLESLATARVDERAALFAAYDEALVWRLLWLGVLSAILAVAAAYFGGRVIGRPLLRMADTARRIAQGELPRPALIAADGEGWLVTRVFARLHERLFDAASQLRHAENEIGALSQALDGSTGRYAAGGTVQASALNETSATTEELARSARQIAANAATVLDVSRQTLEAADSARAMADALSVAVERMKQDNASIAGAVELLGQRVQQVGQVVEFINGVADRTGLLALSADLEGTRAGDVGRGFILVAQEMRNLAENVLESTREIEELIGEVREATRSTQHATSRGTSFAERGLALAGDVTRSLDGVTQLTDETSAAVRTITLATQQQQTGTDQLAEAMSDILGVTQEELNTIRGLTAASERLQALSKELSAAVGRFRFGA